MNKEISKFGILFAVLLLLQFVVLGNMNLGGYITPWVYILMIMLLPFNTPGWMLLVIGMVTGFTVDYFNQSLGLHMSASLMLAYSRPAILRSIRTGIYEERSSPDIQHEGVGWFVRYAALCVIIHHFTLFMLNAFTFANLHLTLLRILLSSVVSVIFILMVEIVRTRRNA